VELQETAVHLQRLLRLERDHELKERGQKDKVFFNWRRASACVLADDLAFKGMISPTHKWLALIHEHVLRAGFASVFI
jgi:hypothetical protein